MLDLIIRTQLIIISLICSFNNLVNGHGRLHDPPARTTAWRYDKSFPAEYTDNQMFCGGFAVQWGKNGNLNSTNLLFDQS
jgi:hypothetical protein